MSEPRIATSNAELDRFEHAAGKVLEVAFEPRQVGQVVEPPSRGPAAFPGP